MSAVYEMEFQINQAIRAEKSLPSMIFNPDDVAQVASLYWQLSPFDNPTQFGREFMPAGIHHPRDVAKDPEKCPPVFMSSPEGAPGVLGCFTPADKGNDVREPKYTPAIERAKDIAERYAQFGVFVPAHGLKPSREECRKAQAMLESKYKKDIELTDEMWRKTGRVKDGISTARIAAAYFGIERDWNERAGEQDVCPYCSRSVKSKAVKCGNANCGAILDWSRAYQGGIVSKEQAQEHGVVVK